MKSAVKGFIAMVLFSMLAGCGGGGGGSAPAAVPTAGTATGSYSGSFSGPAPSPGFELTISANGDIAGHGVNVDGSGGEALTGKMINDTQFDLTASGGCILNGTVNLYTGAVSGTWHLPNSTVIYDFSGTKK